MYIHIHVYLDTHVRIYWDLSLSHVCVCVFSATLAQRLRLERGLLRIVFSLESDQRLGIPGPSAHEDRIGASLPPPPVSPTAGVPLATADHVNKCQAPISLPGGLLKELGISFLGKLLRYVEIWRWHLSYRGQRANIKVTLRLEICPQLWILPRSDPLICIPQLV